MDGAFLQIFGPDLGAIDRELQNYISRFQMSGLQWEAGPRPPAGEAAPLREVEAESILGDLAGQMGGSEIAERHLTRASSLDPTYVPARVARARLRLQDQRFAEALDLLSGPDVAASDASVQYALAEALRGLERHAEAITAYQRVVALQPEASYAHYGLSLAQQAMRDPAAAESFAR